LAGIDGHSGAKFNGSDRVGDLNRLMHDPKQAIVQHIPGLRRYALALLADRDRADDLVQDTLERAWSRIHLWRPTGDFRAWLMTIMHNVFANSARRHSRSQAIVDLADSVEAASPDPGPVQALEVRDLSRALTLLPTERREVLLLVAMEGFSYRETAEILDVPVGTVMSRLGRARGQLRKILRGEGHARLRRVK